MPAFIKNGPNIPVRLLQIHEEGKVVFFCGAGISQPAGLPDFKGLVEKLHNNLGLSSDSVLNQLIESQYYDKAIERMEKLHHGGRPAVRKQIAQILTLTPEAQKKLLYMKYF